MHDRNRAPEKINAQLQYFAALSSAFRKKSMTRRRNGTDEYSAHTAAKFSEASLDEYTTHEAR